MTYRLWYGGDRRTLNYLLSKGGAIVHCGPNVIEVSNLTPRQIRDVRGVFALDAPRTQIERALVVALQQEGYLA